MITLIHGDAIEELKKIKIKVDCIIADIPQGITRNKWDIPFNLEKLWLSIEKIVDNNTPIILMSNQPYTSILISSNIKNYKYSWYWKKGRGRGHLNAKKQPLRDIEEICVFYKKQCYYSPIMKKGIKPHKVGKALGTNKNIGTTYNNFKRTDRESNLKYPKQLLEFKEPHPAVYSTQKPVELLEYLLKTYTKEGDIVLDFCMGSGTTGVACKKLNRNFIGIDKSLEALEIAKNRLEW
ncbi:DNA-methyltransferase [Fusobacterium ulcerans]|uniref:DNA-methyltransferase n=1 Tax=Fusobacterium ulcerans TaxID=861 RepID=UPI0015589047|nr:site-specific DNA-methyltransferase [Fusobacterium ulcerans]